MSKDYAKTPTKRRAPSRNRRPAKTAAWRRVPGWLWLVTVVVVCGFLYGLYAIQLKHNPPALASGQLPSGPRPAPPKKILPPPPAQQWTFHEVLRDKTVAVPEPTPVKTPTPTPAAPPKSWILGCGTFSTPDQAQSLKAQLAFAGLQAEVKPVVNDQGQSRYRVNLGPYASKRAAQKDQHQASAAKIHSCRIF
ncbi:MAG: SPOR domain-containing protein [Gammaproteobacteria bacterium]|nr:SPOR domain-containing protein [Gammaproteobacteria bacterium]